MMYRRGFTLLEVMIVVIIIGVLAAIALPQYTTTVEKARSGEAVTNVGGIRTALDRYWYEKGSIPADLNALDIDNPNSVTNRLYNYSVTASASTERIYTITAERSGNAEAYWVKWIQKDNNTGQLYRSARLGGPSS